MKTKSLRSLWLLGALAFGIALTGTTPLTAQEGCKAVDEAMDKLMTIPTHIYTEMSPVLSNGAKPRPEEVHHTETVYAGGAAFTKLSGTWQRSPWDVQRVVRQEQENRRVSKFSCRYLRDEPLNGEIAAVYGTHSERDEVHSDGQIWVSKSKGLPLRQEADIEMTIGGPGGKSGKNHSSSRYEYANVQAPL
jgi:hypothetical protein